MTKREFSSLNRRLASLKKRAEGIEDEACNLLNDLSAELIPTTPKLTDEAGELLKNSSLHTLSRAIDAIMEVMEVSAQ